ncbi:hypothetical protein BSFP_061000 [Burkholderia stabilis]|uniref:Uncharacterized protein n=1 Tax=Burkholderia stabilis TaxID=95485 RepID=A0A1Y1BT67_9BURK|nr:hypothetical protein BSFP_061000 [Burkholderia stabilis]
MMTAPRSRARAGLLSAQLARHEPECPDAAARAIRNDTSSLHFHHR